MPSYFNPYNNFYPVGYANQMGYSSMPQTVPQQNYMPQQTTATGPNCAMGWVDGEIEARGRQMPQGVTQYAMWDTNQPVIYLKSLNQMGMPNPMQILRYTIEEAKQNLPAGQSGDSAPSVDMSQYATKDELNRIREDLQEALMNNKSNSNYASNNQNGSNNRQAENRGGNR